MQTVSRIDEWKQAHKKTLLNESFVEVSLDIADPESVADASREDAMKDNGAIYISDSRHLTDGLDNSPTPYCTLEQNLWCLDGGRKAIPDSGYKDECYVGDVLSNDTCIFDMKYPTLTIDFSKVFTVLIPGVTITWSKVYGEFADTFEVIAYNGSTIVASKEVTNNRSITSIVLSDIINYNRIEIIIKKWCLPYHRARVEEIFVGARKVYGKTDLFDFSHTQSADPASLSLPKTEISFSVDNVDGEYNPHNSNGLAKYLTERQEVKTRYGLKMDDGTIEWVKGGTFYLSEWYAKQNGITADFVARDLLECLSTTYVEKPAITTRTLYSLAQMLLVSAELPLTNDGKQRWLIDESLKGIETNAPLPEDTIANLLQLIANAGMCVMYQDRDGILHIEPLKDEKIDYEINAFNSYSKSEITFSKPIQKVTVRAYQYSNNGNDSTYVLLGERFGMSGEIIEIDNPLVTNTNHATSICQWITSILVGRRTLDFSWRADVRLDVLDRIINTNSYGSRTVRMTEVNYKFNGAFRATGKGKVMGDG